MDFREALKQMLRERNKTQLWLANELGSRSQSRVGKLLENNNITIKNLIAVCDALDYEIRLSPKSEGEAVVIDSAGKPDKAERAKAEKAQKLAAQLEELSRKQEKLAAQLAELSDKDE